MENPFFEEEEKQLITALAWFRTRYALFLGCAQDRKADQPNLNVFGDVWFGSFKKDWSEAFQSLVGKNVLQLREGEYSFTEFGIQAKNLVESETPFFKYEYDHYFNLEKNSPAHARFCEEVYGMDLSQHGLTDQAELARLIELLKHSNTQRIADIGCGNGKITEWISKQTGAWCVGIDISSEAIALARQRAQGNELLHFETGNLNRFSLSQPVNRILFIDTLYYADDLKKTLQNAWNCLLPGGSIHAYFSQWIMDEAYAENLLPENTHLAKALNEMNLSFSTVDLTASGLAHWKTKEKVLMEMKQDFKDEGNEALWDYRFREASRYSRWGDTKYARYLYTIPKP